MRNLGFEDTPDYDYLRDLFTQALKNTGEVEDGDYDWMKLNNGKGWEQPMKQHAQHHLHQANAIPNSAKELHNVPRNTTTPRPNITPDRLNQAQPPTPQLPAKPGVGKTHDQRQSVAAAPPKRQSGAAGGLADVVTPTASTQAQFQNSTANLPHRMSHAQQTMSPQVTPQNTRQATEPQPTFVQKVMKVLCCGR